MADRLLVSCCALGTHIIDYHLMSVICNIFHLIKYRTAVTASLGFYFEEKMHKELP